MSQNYFGTWKASSFKFSQLVATSRRPRKQKNFCWKDKLGVQMFIFFPDPIHSEVVVGLGNSRGQGLERLGDKHVLLLSRVGEMQSVQCQRW